MGGGASVEKVPPAKGWELNDRVVPSYTPGGKYWVSSKYEKRPIIYAASGPGSAVEAPPTTFVKMLQSVAEKKASKTAFLAEPVDKIALKSGAKPEAMHFASLPRDQWKQWTYAEYLQESKHVGGAMLALGGKKFDGVCIFGLNSPWWIMAATSSMLAGLLPAGMYPTDTFEQIEYKTRYADASFAFCGETKQYAAYETMVHTCPKLLAIVVWGIAAPVPELTRKDGTVVKVMTWECMVKLGQAQQPALVEAAMNSAEPGECCTIVFTSGTTGKPKAVMLSHDNLAYQATSMIRLIDGFGEDTMKPERVLSYLPLSHVAGLCMDIVLPVSVGALKPGSVELFFARPYDLKAGTLKGRLTFVKPTAFLGVPRVWEKVAMAVKAKAKKGLLGEIAKFAKSKGLEYETNRQVGGNGVRPKYHKKVEGKILIKIKKALGLEECKLALTGAAPMPAEIQKYFGSLGISINDLYGMTECTGVTTGNNEETHMWGTVGQNIPGVEVRIFKVDERDVNNVAECPRSPNGFAPSEAEQGEVCYRGRHIMLGYYANPALGQEHVDDINAKNAETIDTQGFLHSGDKGCCSAVNMYHITGRYKELIIGAGGENIAPVPVEDAVKNIANGVSNFLMIGDKRKFNTALVTLKAVGANGENPGGDDLDPTVLGISPGVTKVSEAMKDETWIAHIENAIRNINEDPRVCISHVWRIQKFMILPRDMSVVTDEFTPTLKTKRSYVDQKYVKVIDAMYDPAAKQAYVPCPDDEAKYLISLCEAASAKAAKEE